MSDITIVTAYFDIGRGNWNNSERGNNKYINYFKFWARIKNFIYKKRFWIRGKN